MKYGMYYGRIEPVQATDDMTIEVGQRLGKLFTYEDSAVLPEPTDENSILMIENNNWVSSMYMYNKITALFTVLSATALRESIANTLINTSRYIILGGE